MQLCTKTGNHALEYAPANADPGVVFRIEECFEPMSRIGFFGKLNREHSYEEVSETIICDLSSQCIFASLIAY